jgi:hypothetical protein
VDMSPFAQPFELSSAIRRPGKSFVALPGRRIYNASDGLSCHASVEKVNTEAPEILRGGTPSITESEESTIIEYRLSVRGILIDKVQWVSDAVTDGVIPHAVLRKASWRDDINKLTVPDAPEKLWRLLVADRGPDGQPPPAFYPKACTALLVKTAYGHIDTVKLRETPHPTIVHDYLETVRDVIWNRTFLKTKRKKLMGVGPRNIREGDVIVVLFGCSVPVILRPYRHDKASKSNLYIFIGEAFVYGQMDGEAVATVKRSLQDVQEDFQIV